MIERIETKNLVLRKAKDSDLITIWKNVWIDHELAKTMLWTPTETQEEAEERLVRTKAYQAQNHAFFVCIKETDEPIGFGGVRETEPGVYDETGLCIARAYQHRGYGKELLSALIGLVFENLGGHAFTYGCFHENTASAALAKSCGFVYMNTDMGFRQRDGYVYQCDHYILNKQNGETV